ncbi:MAG: 2-oxoacid:ferredoxin oxidoreductase subunit gamma [Candidatus Cloacimonadota bacterium]|nr:MAG: 2-oxoacid:ferredoxin oxidoreductase subunit gamma [Candidatus Cloacimonadota bacterium]PIE78946.1 MAG: 2-oxoacid:ferredoxin oxidoreductase subunit gamma [Candidatus Delongbacteria bacterium]
MLQEVIFAGFGGQGVLTIAKQLAYTAMLGNSEVAWMPTYGPEMRGGTCGCTVSVSDNPISSPILDAYDTAVVLNLPSLKKYEPKVKKGGLLIWESTAIAEAPTRDDITIVPIPAYEEATKLGNTLVMGMILLGAFIQKTGVITIEGVVNALKKTLPERRHKLIPLNEAALKKGFELAEKIN